MSKLYFRQTEMSVKKFIFKENSPEELANSRTKLLDELARINGKFVCELLLNEMAMLMVVEFDNKTVMSAWETLVSPVTVLNDVKTCRLLVISESNSKAVSKKLEDMVKAIHKYHGRILLSRCTSITEYQILLYFSKPEDLKKFEEKYNLI